MKPNQNLVMMPFTKTTTLILLFIVCTISSVRGKEILDDCCSVPYDKEILCTDLPYNFNPESTTQLQNLFGRPTQHGACWIDGWDELTPKIHLNSCRVGTIERRFKITPKNYSEPVTCKQVIYVNGVHDYKIKFPEDAASNCGIPNPNKIEVEEFSCDLLSVSVRDERFIASSDECYKILRTYRVINWCEFDEENSKAITISRDEDCDGKPGDEGVWVIKKANGNVFIDRDGNHQNKIPDGAELDASCGRDDHYQEGYWRTFKLTPESPIWSRRGYWQYTQVIKVFDGNAPRLEAEAHDPFCSDNNSRCTGKVEVSFTAAETCTPDEVSLQVFLFVNGEEMDMTPDNDISAEVLNGEFPNFTLSGTYPIGNHEFAVLATDGCGNVGSLRIPFEVKDCAAPAPICIDMLSTNLMPVYDEERNLTGGMSIVWAEDFVTSDLEDCTSDISFSIHLKASIDEGIEEPSPDHTNIEITCEHGPVVSVYVYTWDAHGNYSKCVAAIRATDFLSLCDPFADLVIAGQILTPLGEVVDQVEVNLGGMAETATSTLDNGFYVFNELGDGSDFTITPSKNDNPTNGVSTNDLIHIKRHILGTILLETPYQIIAADADKSGSLSARDLLHLRRLILVIDDEFRNNHSWRFIDKHHQFTDPANPFMDDFPESALVKDMDQRVVDMDFVALKVGDVTGDAVPGFQANAIETRTTFTKVFHFQDQLIRAGESAKLNFSLKPEDMVAGLQFSLTADPVSFKIRDFQTGTLAGDEHLNPRFREEGTITFSWNTASGANLSGTNETLFTLELKALHDVSLSEAISIHSRYTKAIALREDGQEGAVQLNFTTAASPPLFQLGQNYPNPFAENSVIGFSLPQEEEVTLRIFTLEGREVHFQNGRFPAGYNTFSVTAEPLPSGVYLYRVDAGGYSATRKMIVR